MLPTDIGTAAHWRWGLSCMAATSRKGATGRLRRSEVRSLLKQANASSVLKQDSIDDALACLLYTSDAADDM
eukprot:2648703-Prymnesium_polylepis.1